MRDWSQWFWLIPALAHVAAAGRVVFGRAPLKHGFLVALAIALPAVEIFGNLSHGTMEASAYYRLWLGCYLLIYSLVALALTEACTRSIESYERFGAAGRSIIRSILAVSGVAMIGLLFLMPDSASERFLAYMQAQSYLAQGSLALLGCSMLAFTKWTRLKLQWNSGLTMVCLTALSAMEALLGAGLGAAWSSWITLFGMSWSAVWWLVLAFCWSSQNQPVVIARPKGVAEGVAPALAHMDSLNQRLTELVRRS